ncbi:hypothetical protein MNV49_004260 [Pseudohyphozyma bogoriensis]|nr:hypothetical protein MNV49_004260 [Pseudohyphozyma bogoriensis]
MYSFRAQEALHRARPQHDDSVLLDHVWSTIEHDHSVSPLEIKRFLVDVAGTIPPQSSHAAILELPTAQSVVSVLGFLSRVISEAIEPKILPEKKPNGNLSEIIKPHASTIASGLPIPAIHADSHLSISTLDRSSDTVPPVSR